jgi:hypothetical protein
MSITFTLDLDFTNPQNSKLMNEFNINFSNRNAMLVLETIGICDGEYCGIITLDQIGNIQRLLNLGSPNIKTVKPEVKMSAFIDENGIHNLQPRFFDPGADIESMKRRLTSLQHVLTKAQELGCHISFS